MNKKNISLLLLIILVMSEFSYLAASEVAEGFFGGGLLGSAIGGAAGGGRGAAIGGAVGAGVGAMTGAAVREGRRRRYEDYYEDSEMLREQNEELRDENENLIRKHKKLVQYYEQYNWMLDQCKAGKTDYRKEAKQLTFDDDTNYSKFKRWKNKESVRSQNKLLVKANSQLRKNINTLKSKTRRLKENLYKYEETEMAEIG